MFRVAEFVQWRLRLRQSARSHEQNADARG